MGDAFSNVIGQPRAVEELRAHVKRPIHAYLFVGPAGAGKLDAARAFASVLVGSTEEPEPRVLHNTHPDVVILERQGASISVDQAREIARDASRSPIEAPRKVLILTEFHLVADAAPALLKTIEEASETTVFIILAESVPPDLITIASRCVHVEFSTVDPQVIAQQLVAEGVPADRAIEAAEASRGSLDRARVLANDESVIARRELWKSVLGRLDGTGNTQWSLANEIVASLDDAVQPLIELQGKQVEEDRQRENDFGFKTAPGRVVESAHKREQRRLRTDELRNGFAVMREQIGKSFIDARTPREAARLKAQVESVAWAEGSLQFNPTDALLLHGLFARLDTAGSQ